MSTERQQAANRANAQMSTGPITPEGKAASSQNNRKLGLAANIFQVLPHECQEDFDDYAANLYQEYDPQSLVEQTLVLKMAQHYWLGQRAVCAQNTCFHYDFAPAVENRCLRQQLALYIRYQAHHDRGFHKCLAELQKIQALRQNDERKEELHSLRVAKLVSQIRPSKPSTAPPPPIVPKPIVEQPAPFAVPTAA